MTSAYLLLWIALGFFLQLVVWLGIVFWRHWQTYRGLSEQLAESSVPAVEAAALPAPAWSGCRNFRVARKVAEDVSASVSSFYLEPEDGQPLPGFRPGQFLTFSLEMPAGENLVRCYSLSDAPHPDYYRVSIKRALPPAGSAHPVGRSSNYFHDHIDVGSTLQVRAPGGHFYLEAGDLPVVLIGGGVGITPMLSMLNWVLAAQPGREVWLFYGLVHAGEGAMLEHLQALAEAHANFHLKLCLSRPQPGDAAVEHHPGRIDVDLLRQTLPLKPYHFYICGPTPMMESLVPALEDWGVPDSRIHFEAFGPASIKRRTPGAMPQATAPSGEIIVTFALSGQKLAWDPAAANLLDFAESHGINVKSGCRAGGCGSCQTSIKSGEVAYGPLPDFDPEPGTCLLCVCTPKTSLVLEA